MDKLNETRQMKENKPEAETNLFKWFKFIVGILFSALLVYKLAISDLTFDFSKFDFNSLLSLILALFAISLSVAFYFKATDTSNLFYDNTYKFTKEISEILGRIEAGFGERLRHLDEGYSGLVNKFDNGSSELNIKEIKEEIEKEKLKLKQEIQERNNIFNSLLEKSQLEQHEKEEVRKQLKEKELEISKQNRELNFLKNKLVSEHVESSIDNLPPSIREQFVYFIKKQENPELILRFPISLFIKKYRFDVNEIDKDELVELQNLGLIEKDGSFTMLGIKILRQITRRLLKY